MPNAGQSWNLCFCPCPRLGKPEIVRFALAQRWATLKFYVFAFAQARASLKFRFSSLPNVGLF